MAPRATSRAPRTSSRSPRATSRARLAVSPRSTSSRSASHVDDAPKGLLSFAPAALLSPHARRNRFIRTGYAVHESLWDAAVGVFALHNETLNALTGAVCFVVAAWLWGAAGPHYLPADSWRVRYLAAWLAFQAACVVIYHTLLSVPAWYDVTSAIDLAGIALLCCGLLASSHIPGMSIMHAGLSSASSDAVFVVETAVILMCAAAAVVTRLRIKRESPPALLAANCAWYVLIVTDFAIGSWPAPASLIAPLLLAGGVVVYATRFPERLFPHVVFDLFNSHTLWHVCYTASMSVYGGHALACATAAGRAAAAAR